MFRTPPYRTLPIVLLIAMLFLSGCAPLFQPVRVSGTAPTPVISFEEGGVDNPDVFVDPTAFRAALLQALNTHDTEKLQIWMTEPFLTGTWRADLSDTSPADAINSLYADQLGEENHLALVTDADLKALLGDKNPLSIPSSEAGVMDAFLVSGWGKDGRDEAILFVVRQADNSLKWHGWMQIQGGFSGERLGGIQPYNNDALGFGLYLPKGYQISEPTANYVNITAPQEYGGHPGGAYLFVELAYGRTAEQIVEAVKAEQGPGFNISVSTVLDIDGTQALVVIGIPGQDLNRQLFMVHNDLLYHIIFMPDDPRATNAYRQMQDIYTTLINTFRFTK